jgi:protocatechuate 3,4-dioxygenase beta subunit
MNRNAANHMSRGLALVLSLVALRVPLSSQAQALIVPEYLAPQYTAPSNAPSTVVIAGKDEPGERLVVTGRTLVGKKPVAGVSLYVFHTDINGLYAPDISDLNAAELNPRLHSSLRTDAQGRYQYETIRPGSYGNGASHVHYVVKAPGYKPLLLALQFEDDPIVVRLRKAGRPLLDPNAFKNGPCKSRPDCVLIRPVKRDAQGVSHVTRDIQMVQE